MAKKELQVCSRMFFRKIKKILTKILRFLANVVVNKILKSKKFADNPFPNILRLSNVLRKFPLTTSKTMGDYHL